jgi:hypothetical protein
MTTDPEPAMINLTAITGIMPMRGRFRTLSAASVQMQVPAA